jgi:hypothetical protein
MKWKFLPEEFKKKCLDNIKMCSLCVYPEFSLDDAIFHQQTGMHKGFAINTHYTYRPINGNKDYKHHIKSIELFNLGSVDDKKTIKIAREKEFDEIISLYVN